MCAAEAVFSHARYKDQIQHARIAYGYQAAFYNVLGFEDRERAAARAESPLAPGYPPQPTPSHDDSTS